MPMAFLMGAYIDIRDRKKMQARRSIAPHLAVVKYKQDKEHAAFLMGAYIDVRDRKKTQARRSIAPHFIGKNKKAACI
jgi:hypothetical protein